MTLDSWQTKTLSSIAEGGSAGIGGGPFGSALGRKDYTDTGVPVIRGAQLSATRSFSHEDLVFVTESKADSHPRNLAHPGDLIVTQRGTLGQVGLIPRDAPYPRYLLSQSQMKITVDRALADAKFVFYALRAPNATTRLTDHALVAGVPHINLGILRNFQLDLPPVKVQQRVARLLAAFDDLIEINERRIELLEDLARSLYREWFVQLRFPGHGTMEPSDAAPAGWTLHRLTDVAGVNEITAKVEDLPDPLRYIDIASVKPRRIEDVKTMSASAAPGRARRRLRDGDIVWAMVRPNRRSHALVHDPPKDVIASTGFAVLSPRNVPAAFLFELVSRPEFADYLMGRATGAAYPAVRPDDFESAPVLIPPADVLSRFGDIADPALRLASRLVDANHALARTRDLILPRLVTGKLDIADIDLSEILLEEAAP